MRCRLAPVRSVSKPPPPIPQHLRLCGLPRCSTLILVTAGATATNQCTQHQGVANEPESDETFIERVCAAMNWRRTK
jgi:hypothetical protein